MIYVFRLGIHCCFLNHFLSFHLFKNVKYKYFILKIDNTVEINDFEPVTGSRVSDAWSHRDRIESMPFQTYMSCIWFNIWNLKNNTRHGHDKITLRTNTNPSGLKVVISTVPIYILLEKFNFIFSFSLFVCF